MTTEISEKLYTVEEFLDLNLPDNEVEDYELIGGRIVAKSSGAISGEHSRIVGRLSQYLNNYLDTNPIGTCYPEGASTLGRPKGSNFVRPDVCFVAKGRTPAKFKGPIPVAPDLVIEVNSPSDNNETMQEKVDAYLEAGVRLVWSLYMVQKFLVVYRSGERKRSILDLDEELDGEDVLPGFKLPVSKLFE